MTSPVAIIINPEQLLYTLPYIVIVTVPSNETFAKYISIVSTSHLNFNS
jgi:hypothetical protein